MTQPAKYTVCSSLNWSTEDVSDDIKHNFDKYKPPAQEYLWAIYRYL